MSLAQEDITFIKEHLGEWLTEISLGKPVAVYETELRERIIRVEEELRHQRELMQQGFAMMDKRFEEMHKSIDKRFEQVDKRFESIQQDISMLNQRMERFMIWSFTSQLTVGGLIVAILKFWN